MCIRDRYTICIETKGGGQSWLTSNGRFIEMFDGECTLFPSKDQRDWSKFKVEKPKFDLKTLQAFDKVLVRDSCAYNWKCAFYSHKRKSSQHKYVTTESVYEYCIPYNDDTKHLVGTSDEAPEFYRYWDE